MTVAVELSKASAKALERAARDDRRLYDRLIRALERLAAEPTLGKPLHGPLTGRRSHRVGSHRIIYRFDAGRLVVLVLDIGPRGRVYR